MEGAVEDLCDQITLTELEEEVAVDIKSLEEVVMKGLCCLLLKLFTNGPYNREAFKVTLKKIWSLTSSVLFSKLVASIILAIFENITDKMRALRESPWKFDEFNTSQGI